MKKLIASLVFIFSVISFIPTTAAYSDQTLACIDRINGHVLRLFPKYDSSDTTLKTKVENSAADFCLKYTPAVYTSVNDYTGLTDLGKAEWDMLESFSSDAIFKKAILDSLMEKPTVFSMQSTIKAYTDELLSYKKSIQDALSIDTYINDQTSFVYKVSQLIDVQYSNFSVFTSDISDNLAKNYTCTETECTLTSSIPQPTQQQPTQQTQIPVIATIFTDVPSTSDFYYAIKYLKDNNIVSGYADGSYKPLNSINRAEFTKIIIGSLGVSGVGADCFPDVKTEWFAPYVCYAKTNYIIGGYTDGTFKPNQNINLAESLKIVLLALKVNLSTNTGTNWYDIYVNTATENNLLSGINTELTHQVTRGEMAQLIYNIKK